MTVYGNGLSEQLVGEAIRDFDREKLYLVSKILPQNAGKKHMRKSIDRTLRLMHTDYLDLYLLHWRGSIPLRETVQCMEELVALPNGENCMVNQVLYHLGSRGIEYFLKPWMDAHGVALMAYCPLAQGGELRRELMNHLVLKRAEHFRPRIINAIWISSDRYPDKRLQEPV